MKRFEYQTKIIEPKNSFWSAGGKFDPEYVDKVLNEMARERWELVEAAVSNQFLGETISLICIFKRELE